MFARVVRFDLDLPALALGIAGVHAEQIAGEDRRLVTAGTRAHFQEQVAVIARIARHQQQGQCFVQLLQALLRGDDFLVGQFAQVRVLAHRFGGGEIGLGAGFVGQRSSDRLQLRKLARERAETVVVTDHGRVGQQAFQFFAALGQRFQLTAQGRRHHSSLHRYARQGAGNPAWPGTGARRRG